MTVALCNACLRRRDDIEAGWLAAACVGKQRTTHYCDDDFAFAALESVTSPTRCPSCGNSTVVIPVDEALAARVESYVQSER
jgi:hypothetical protein